MPEFLFRTVVVEPDEAGQTIAKVVRGAYVDMSWSKARALVRSGRVIVDGLEIFDDAHRLDDGQVVEINPTGKKRAARMLPEDRIVHLDHDVVLVDKPAGVVTVPYDEDERDTDSLLAQTRERLRQMQTARGQTARDGLGVVQRLDKDTTGLLVFPRTHKARKHLQSQLRNHTMERRYVALCHGVPEDATIETTLVPDRGDGRRGSWRGGGRPPRIAKRAITHLRVLQSFDRSALVECRLETGRQHQIRIHLAELGHPLIGERIYNKGLDLEAISGDLFRRLGAARPMLHAATLGFRHPGDERRLHRESPLPDDLRALLADLEGRNRDGT